MIVIQILLIVLTLSFVFILLKNRNSRSIRAYKKIGVILLACAMIVVILFPELSNKVAHLLGVGRGADLLLYMTVMAFILFVLNDYLYRQEQRDTIIRLTRTQSLSEARSKYKDKLKERD